MHEENEKYKKIMSGKSRVKKPFWIPGHWWEN